MSTEYGVISHEPIETYHSTDAWSKSKLDEFRTLPLRAFKRYIEKSIPREGMSKEFLIGQSSHCLVLEGLEEFNKRFVCVPSDAPDDLRRFRDAKKPSDATVASIKWWDAFTAESQGKQVISQNDLATNNRLRKSVRDHELASCLLSEGEAELTFRVRSTRYDLQCRADWVNFNGASKELVRMLERDGIRMEEGEPYAVDYKTCETLDQLAYHGFEKNFETFGYHRQGPFYRSIIKDATSIDINRFFFIATEKDFTAQTAVFLPSDQTNETGWDQVMEDMMRLNECYDSGVWPGLPPGCRLLELKAEKRANRMGDY